MKSTVTAEILATSKAIRESHLSRGTLVLIAALVMSVVPAYATFPA